MLVPLISPMSLALFLSCSLSVSWLSVVYVSVDHCRLKIEDRGSSSDCDLNTAHNRAIDIYPLSEIMSDWSGIFFCFWCREEPTSLRGITISIGRDSGVFFWPYDWVFASVFMLFAGSDWAGTGPVINYHRQREVISVQRSASQCSASSDQATRDRSGLRVRQIP